MKVYTEELEAGYYDTLHPLVNNVTHKMCAKTLLPQPNLGKKS